MKTHICIRNPTKNPENLPNRIKKGDYVTKIGEGKNNKLVGDFGYEFEEHVGMFYSSNLFLPLPPEKTVYITVEKEIVKKEELVMS